MFLLRSGVKEREVLRKMRSKLKLQAQISKKGNDKNYKLCVDHGKTLPFFGR